MFNNMPRLIIFKMSFLLFASFYPLCAVPTGSVPRKNQTKKGNIVNFDKVKVELNLAKNQVKMDEHLDLKLSVVNNGDKSVYIYKNTHLGLGGGLLLHLMDDEHKKLKWADKGEYRNDTLLPPPANRDDVNAFVEILPGMRFEIDEQLAVKSLCRTPGKFFLNLEYWSPVRKVSYGPKVQALPVIWQNTVELKSKDVSITIE